MFKNILLAYDGSQHAREAANLAGDLVRGQKCRSTVCIVTAVTPFLWDPEGTYISQYYEDCANAGKDMIQDATLVLGSDVEVQSELLFGPPAENILKVAEARACDLIIIGTRGLSLIEGLLLGSQAQKVINHARCPVLVVK